VKTVRVGNITLASNLVQGPLAGYSCAPFRALTTRFGQPGFCTTEMISAKDLVHRRTPLKRYTWRDPTEGLLSYQLSGNDPDDLGRASAIVSELGADIIDLNAGCPVNKIRSKGCGSSLLANPEQLYTLVKAIKNNTGACVSIKIRVEGNQHDHNDAAVADAIQQGGADFVTVHGRHWTENYEAPCRIESIAAIKKHLQIPVFANGDVCDGASLERLLTQSGCDGVMIARASVGQPWLFQQLRAELSHNPYSPPSIEEVGTNFWEHIEGLIALENEKIALLEARKFAKYYARHLPQAAEFISEMLSLTGRDRVAECIKHYFQ